MESIWNNVTKREFTALGGLCGILCAYMFKKAGINYILVEADKICHGITNATTAKITVQHGLIYDSIIRQQMM